ncbi:beta-1,3-galactosyltransferase 5-like [Dermacentor variabilis]|uniref:beta-1,3-galactosyltransferase 5-like n=1 Tax=Dermacentor variabilis TaxID=34621 RepID=UPI003F5B3255
MSHATASGFSQPYLALWEGRHVMVRLKFAVFGMWTLAVLFTLNYAFLRMCVSDMRWHARQLDIIPRVVGTRGFPVLPGVACPRYLAVVVCSSVERFEHRAAIRATWGRDVGDDKGAGVFFLVGKPDATPRGQDIQNRLINESARHNDVIQADFRDTYRNLTIKTLFLLKWAYVNCSSTRFVLKADDDMFVNVERLLSFLEAYGGNRARPFLAGHVLQGRKAVRQAGSKWYLPLSVYEPDWLPSYVYGSGYVMSREAVRPLFTEALSTPFLYVEDVFLTGIVAQKVGIELTNSRCFIPYAARHPCDYRNFISTHEPEPDNMRLAWQIVHDADDQCPPADDSLVACSYARFQKEDAFLESLLRYRISDFNRRA